MIDQNPNINSIPQSSAPTPPQNVPQALTNWKSLLAKVKLILASIFNKFHLNKKVFWPVGIALGLIFLVIILGLLFGKRSKGQVTTKLPTPSPITQNTPQASTSGNILTDSRNKLNDLKNQINNLDVQESRLQPPTLNFNIKF
jgi:hypothetical protein